MNRTYNENKNSAIVQLARDAPHCPGGPVINNDQGCRCGVCFSSIQHITNRSHLDFLHLLQQALGFVVPNGGNHLAHQVVLRLIQTLAHQRGALLDREVSSTLLAVL